MTGWLPEGAELAAYEGLRRGDERAFRLLAEALHPALLRLARLYVSTDAKADKLVLRTWREALRGLSMFRWQSPLATWVARITVAAGRVHEDRKGRDGRETAALPADIAPVPHGPVPGPRDWSDLPWSARWEHAGDMLRAALASLPTAELEVVHGRDVEQWPERRVCDVFGLTEESYERLLDTAHGRLHQALAAVVGERDPGPYGEAQMAALSRWLGERNQPRPQPLDPRVVATFRRWSGGRRHGRWWLSLRGRLIPAGGRGPGPGVPAPSRAAPTAPRSRGRAGDRSDPG